MSTESELRVKLAAAESRANRLVRRNAELVGVLRAIKQFAEGHHDQQPEHYWLHALKVDIPEMCERAMGPEAEMWQTCRRCGARSRKGEIRICCM